MSEFKTILVQRYVISCEGVLDNKLEFTDFEEADDKLCELRKQNEGLEFNLFAQIDA